ncbi:MAG: MarR family winged helix-turn-helix transcriptional regulator [Pseudonocardia sp.]
MDPADGAGQAEDGPPAGDDEAVAAVLQAVRAVALGLDRYRQALGARHGIGVAEIVTLGQLLFEGPVRASDVSVRTGLTQSSVTALVDRLESRGYVLRTRPPGNRRTVLVEPTPAGRELGHAIFGPMLALLRDIPPGSPGLDCLAGCLEHTAAFFAAAATRLRDGSPG